MINNKILIIDPWTPVLCTKAEGDKPWFLTSPFLFFFFFKVSVLRKAELKKCLSSGDPHYDVFYAPGRLVFIYVSVHWLKIIHSLYTCSSIFQIFCAMRKKNRSSICWVATRSNDLRLQFCPSPFANLPELIKYRRKRLVLFGLGKTVVVAVTFNFFSPEAIYLDYRISGGQCLVGYLRNKESKNGEREPDAGNGESLKQRIFKSGSF